MRTELKKDLKSMLFTMIVGAVLAIVWQSYEVLVYGKTLPDIFDVIVTIALAFTITTIREQRQQIKKRDEMLMAYAKHKDKTEAIIESQLDMMSEQTKLIEILNERHKQDNAVN